MKKRFAKIVAIMLTAAVVAGGIDSYAVGAKKAPQLDSKIIEIQKGSTTKLKVKNADKSAKITWKTSKKAVVQIVKKNKAIVVLKGMKKGKAKVTAIYKVKSVTKKMTCKIKVFKGPSVKKPTAEPVVVPPTEVPTVAPTAEPTPVPTPVPTFKVVTANEAIVEKNIPSDYDKMKSGVEYGTFIINDRYYSNITNSERTVNIVLPAGYDESKEYPVVYMMHGIGCSKEMFGTDINGSAIARIYSNLQAEGKCSEMIIVFPGIRVADGPENNTHSVENYKNYDNFREDLIDNLMPHMEENYAVATGRENTAVCGWSMGGREALYIGLSRPDLFGYVAGYCPAFGLLPYTNPGVGKYEPGLLFVPDSDGEIIELPDEYRDNIYVQVSAGIYDDVVKGEPMRYHKALTAGNIPHIYNEYPSGHSDGVFNPGFYVFIMNAFQ
ncbi:MAG: hypothetical protein E7267_07770 [Lachnospiraceae bacterium]|nr:hypothetical protein [Lachnospiraceae bacterium]